MDTTVQKCSGEVKQTSTNVFEKKFFLNFF